MNTNNEHKNIMRSSLDLVFLMTIGVLLGFSVLSAALDTSGFEQGQMMSLVQVFVSMALARLLFSSRYLVWIATSLLTLALLGLAFGALTAPPEPRLINEAADFVRAVVQYVIGYGEYNALYERTFTWFLAALIGIFVVQFLHVRPSFFVTFTVFAAIFGFLISSYLFAQYDMFYLFISCSLVFLIKQLNLTCVKQTQQSPSFLRLALPVALICAILAAFIPTPSEDFTLQQRTQPEFISSLQRLGDQLRFGTDAHHFGIQQAGFGGGDHRRLGGNVTTNDGLFLRIRTNAPQPIYLTGITMDTYTGYSWENRLTEQAPLDFNERYPNLALYEYFAALVNRHPMSHAFVYSVYSFIRPGSVTYSVTHTGYIDHCGLEPSMITSALVSIGYDMSQFHEERTMLIGGINRRFQTVFHTGLVQGFAPYRAEFTLLQEQSGQLLTEELMPRHTWYTLSYIPLPESPLYARYLMRTASYRGILRDISARLDTQRAVVEYSLLHGEEELDFAFILQHYLIPRADWIHETYTALPEDFPARIGEHARAVTAGAENNHARARMLETYLRTQFTYTLTPGMPPSDRDFVDYFLFDSRVGYCTYFATAFVTMARSLDIPARYVEGFLVSNATPDEEGLLRVLNSMGHAWGEIYLEGYGWLRFEPTPPASVLAPPPIEDIEEEAPPEEPPEEPPGETQDDPQYVDLPAIETIAPPGQAGEDTPPTDDPNPEDTPQSRFRILPVSVLTLLALFLAYRVIGHTRKARIARYDNREAVCYDFSLLLKYLKRLGFEMGKAETVFQFYERVTAEPGTVSETLFPRALVELYAKARYGNEPISLKERIHMKQEVRRIQEYTPPRK